MPVQVSYPGVYIQEVPSGVHSIVGVSTSATAFVDVFARGPVDKPVRIDSMADFERTFEGLWPLSEASYAISQYFLNGGETAWVVRVAPDGLKPAKPSGRTAPLTIEAASFGAWGERLQVAVETNPDDGTINVAVREVHGLNTDRPRIHEVEVYNNLTTTPGPKNAQDVINAQSSLISVTAVAASASSGGSAAKTKAAGGSSSGSASSTANKTKKRVTSGGIVNDLADEGSHFVGFTPGDDGLGDDPKAAIDAIQKLLQGDEDEPRWFDALRQMAPEIFNLLCLPATAQMTPEQRAPIDTAAAGFCEHQRAFYLVDCPVGATVATIQQLFETQLTELRQNAAVFFPALTIPDPLGDNRPRTVGPSGTIAGVTARTDNARGIWKAAAGTEAALSGATPVMGIRDSENGELNELGINVLRTFPIYGNVSWGARTLDGADQKESQWKYIPVRRLALHIENSLFAGTKWAVFEPNDEPLWGQLRLSVGSFMHDLFRQGAFAGSSPSDSYFVHCDRTTTTQSDIDNGIVNIVVGFAPLKPAEFVIISIQQIAQV